MLAGALTHAHTVGCRNLLYVNLKRYFHIFCKIFMKYDACIRNLFYNENEANHGS